LESTSTLADAEAMKTTDDIQAVLQAIADEQQYIADTLSTIELAGEDYADDWDFADDVRAMSTELEAKEEALRWVLGTLNDHEGQALDIIKPGAAQDMCRDHGYPKDPEA